MSIDLNQALQHGIKPLHESILPHTYTFNNLSNRANLPRPPQRDFRHPACFRLFPPRASVTSVDPGSLQPLPHLQLKGQSGRLFVCRPLFAAFRSAITPWLWTDNRLDVGIDCLCLLGLLPRGGFSCPVAELLVALPATAGASE